MPDIPALLPLASIVAFAKKRVIGYQDDMPWHYPEDLRHFRRTTQGHAVVMGRTSYEVLGQPLPKRRNIIVTRNTAWQAEGVDVCHDLTSAIALARTDDDLPFILGGGDIYAQSMHLVTRMYLTEIDRDVPGDTFFPEFSEGDWQEIDRWQGTESPELLFRTLERRHKDTLL